MWLKGGYNYSNGWKMMNHFRFALKVIVQVMQLGHVYICHVTLRSMCQSGIRQLKLNPW